MTNDFGFFVLIKNNSSEIGKIHSTLPESDITIETKTKRIVIYCFEKTSIFCGETNGVSIILFGQLYENKELNHLAEQYITQGISSFKNLNGSFAFLLIDKIKDEILIVTDRLASKKVFFYKGSSMMILSTELRYLYSDKFLLDTTALAWYLASGFFPNSRTIFKEISRLSRASCYRIRADQSVEVMNYWHYRFTNEYAHLPIEKLKAELSSLVIESVKKRVNKESSLLLSLSAGYDASGILGILKKISRNGNLCTFSYGMNEAIEKSDPYVARQMAKLCKVDHKFIESYDSNFIDVIEFNALWGDGLSNFCDEVQIWQPLSKIGGIMGKTLFFGDTCLGLINPSVSTIEGVLSISGIRSFNNLPWLKHYLSKNVYDIFSEGVNSEISGLLSKVVDYDNLDDIKDYIYIDQRLSNVILPWRENFAGRFFSVQNPLLDNDLLDFIRKCPTQWRLEKQLYRDVIISKFPEIFTLKRGDDLISINPNWTAEIMRNKDKIIERYIRNRTPSILDEYIDPVSIISLLSLESGSSNTDFSSMKRVVSKAYGNISKISSKAGIKMPANIRPYQVSRTVFLLRYLVLRRFLQIAQEDSYLK